MTPTLFTYEIVNPECLQLWVASRNSSPESDEAKKWDALPYAKRYLTVNVTANSFLESVTKLTTRFKEPTVNSLYITSANDTITIE